MNRSIVVVIGIVAVLIGAGVFVYLRQQGYQGNIPEPFPPAPPGVITEPEAPQKQFDVIGYSATSASTEVFAVGLTDQKRRILFTDQDEDTKIRSIRGNYADGTKAVANVSAKGQQLATILVSVAIDGTGKLTALLDKFGSSEAPIASPDGKSVAYIIFSNADPDYGYSLMLMNTDGSNKKRLVRYEDTLVSPIFNSEGTEIAYIVQKPGGSVIEMVPVDGGAPSKVYEVSNEILYDLSWSKDLVFGKRPKGDATANEGELYSISPTGTGLRRLTNNKDFDGSPNVSPDGLKLGLVRTNFSGGKYTTNGDLSLVVRTLADDAEVMLGSADGVLGWVAAKDTTE